MVVSFFFCLSRDPLSAFPFFRFVVVSLRPFSQGMTHGKNCPPEFHKWLTLLAVNVTVWHDQLRKLAGSLHVLTVIRC